MMALAAPSVDVLSILFFLEAKTAHARVVINTHEVIKRRKLPDRPLLFRSKDLFTPIKQQSSPSVRQGIAEAAEDVPVWLGVLLTGIVVDVGTQKEAAILTKPAIIILERIGV